jgi:hypothetical protein
MAVLLANQDTFEIVEFGVSGQDSFLISGIVSIEYILDEVSILDPILKGQRAQSSAGHNLTSGAYHPEHSMHFSLIAFDLINLTVLWPVLVMMVCSIGMFLPIPTYAKSGINDYDDYPPFSLCYI